MVVVQGLTAEKLEPRALAVLRQANAQLGIDTTEEEVLRVASACYRLRPTNGQPMTDLSAVAEALHYCRKPGGIAAWALGLVNCSREQIGRAQEVWIMMGEAPLWDSEYDDQERED